MTQSSSPDRPPSRIAPSIPDLALNSSPTSHHCALSAENALAKYPHALAFDNARSLHRFDESTRQPNSTAITDSFPEPCDRLLTTWALRARNTPPKSLQMPVALSATGQAPERPTSTLLDDVLGKAVLPSQKYVLRYSRVEIHRSARRHGIGNADIRHAAEHPIVVVDLDAESDPPKVLAIGPDRAGNLLEVIMLELDGDELLAIHAMPLRRAFHELLPQGGDDDG